MSRSDDKPSDGKVSDGKPSDDKPSDGKHWEDAHLSRAARVGAWFEATVSLPDGFEAKSAEGLSGLSLSFDAQTLRVTGAPSKDGVFDILVHGVTGDRERVARFMLPVSPDPSTLWKNLPSDPDGAYARPDSECRVVEGLSGAAWVCASARGRRHAHKGAYRDDALSAFVDPDTDWHIAAVADGAGSAALSREGARIAVTTVAEELPVLLAQCGCRGTLAERDALLDAMVSTARLAIKRIEESAVLEGRPESDFATTLLIGAVRRIEDRWFTASFSIGDGLMAILDSASGQVVRLCATDSGQFAGETLFLHSRLLDNRDACNKRLFIDERAAFDAFAMMSDGVSDPQFDSEDDESSTKTWAQLWSEIKPALNAPQPAEALLRWLDFHVPGEHDDRTLVIFDPTGGSIDSTGTPGENTP